MNRFASIASNVLAITLTGSFLAVATVGTAKAADACRTLSQDTCIADIGCKWREAESWTRQSDGKVRTTKARCAYDAKAARNIIQTALANHIAK